MHIPDGFLKLPVWAALDAVAVPAVGLATWRARSTFQDSRAPLMGVMGAFVFAAQMINFPVGAGTSGHLVGGALLTFTLGPAQASVVMTAILAIQALIFQDGGLLALGANILNMAVAGVLAAWLPWLMAGGARYGVFVGAAFSVMTSALLALTELLISGVPMPGPVLVISLGLFAAAAVIEGAITLVVLQAAERIQPGAMRKPAGRGRAWSIFGAAVALTLGGVFIFSTRPDALEALLHSPEAAATLLRSPLADYEFDAALAPWLSRSLAGLAGLAIVYLVCLVVARMIAASRPAGRGA